MLQLGETAFAVQKGSPDGNIYVLLAAAQKAVRRTAGREAVEQMLQEVQNAESYEEALAVIQKYGITFIFL